MEVQHLPRNVILVASQLRVEPRAVRSCQLQQSSQQITQDIEAGVGPLNLYFCHDRDLFSTSVPLSFAILTFLIISETYCSPF